MNVIALAGTSGMYSPGVSHGFLSGNVAALALVLVWLPAIQSFAAVLSTDVPFGGDLGDNSLSWPTLMPGWATEVVSAPTLAGEELLYPWLEPDTVE
jgi:hypothetical protein